MTVFQIASDHCIIRAASTYGCFEFRSILGQCRPYGATDSQHKDNAGGITIQCYDMIKSLSGERMSEGFAFRDCNSHTKTQNTLNCLAKCCYGAR